MTIGNASAIPTGTEFLVNSFGASYDSFPSIASLSDGGFVVTWAYTSLDGGDYRIHGQRYDSNGAVVGDKFQINTYTNSDQTQPSVTSLADGGFVVTWTSDGQDGSLSGIYGQRYDRSGVTAGAEFQINTYTNDHQAAPSVTSLADGGFVVTWISHVQGGSLGGIFGQRYDSSGATVGAEFQINTNTSNGKGIPSVTSLADGGFVVTWQSHGQDGSFGGIYGQRYNSSGATAGAEFQINTNTDSDQFYPSVTSLTDGGFVVTWTSYWQDESGDGIYGQRYDSSGATVGAEFQINTFTNSDQRQPSVTSLSDGGFVVTWQSSGPDGSLYGIFGQRYDSSGATVGAEFQINTYTNDYQYQPSVASLADGGFVVTWNSVGQDGSGYGIYAQQFSGQLFGTSSTNIIVDTIGANWIHGQGGNDVLRGKWGADVIYGGAGKDALYGGNRSDTLKGGSGSDTLIGGKGNDTLKGNRGADELTGGLGKDTLTGGAGADRFIFNTALDSANSAKADVITDFEVGVDEIDLSALANLSFISNARFSGTGPEVRAVDNGVKTTIRIDADGDGLADMKIILEGVTSVTVSDFIL